MTSRKSNNGKYVAYYRVSTDKQGKSGLGLEAQQATVRNYLNGGKWELIAEFPEVESGRNDSRPELAKALALCKRHRAKLIVAKVDRLTRSASFLHKLLDAGVDVMFCDLPQIDGPIGRFLLQQLVSVAELEAGFIGQRTKAALAASKARGTVLGGYRGGHNIPSEHVVRAASNGRIEAAIDRATNYEDVIREIQATGVTSFNGLAKELNDRGITTAKGGKWQAVQVQRVLEKLKV